MSGGGTQTTTQTSSIPPQFLAAYQNVLNKTSQVASTPYQQYGGPMVAQLNGTQNQALGALSNLGGIQAPYLGQAASDINASTNPLINTIPTQSGATLGSTATQGLANSQASTQTLNNIPQYSGQQLQQYMNPYTQNVVNSTQAEFNNQNAQQQQGVVGNAISSGAWGGDRSAVAQGITAGQQALAQAPVIAGLNQSNFANAQQELNAQQQLALNTGTAQGQLAQGAANQQLGFYSGQQNTMLGANEASDWLKSQAGMGMASLGNQAQSSASQAATAQLGAGTLEQQMAQENLNIPYEQFLARQSYPFQTNQYMANIAEGLGSSAGQNASTTTPGPSTGSQVFGGLLGAASLVGAFMKKGGVVGPRKMAGGGAPLPDLGIGAGGGIAGLPGLPGLPGVPTQTGAAVPDPRASIIPITQTMPGGRGPQLPQMPSGQPNNSAQDTASQMMALAKQIKMIRGDLNAPKTGVTPPTTADTPDAPGATPNHGVNGTPGVAAEPPPSTGTGTILGNDLSSLGAWLGNLNRGGVVGHTVPEPPADVHAQIAALSDPYSAKQSVFLASGTHVPPGLPDDIHVVHRPEGTLLTRDPQAAHDFGAAPHLTESHMASLLGYPQHKGEALASGNPMVVQGRANGGVAYEAVTAPGHVARAAGIAAAHAPGGQIVVTSPQQAMVSRMHRMNLGGAVQHMADGGTTIGDNTTATLADGSTPIQFNPWLAGAAAGFGMMAGTSPFFGVNMGRGMEAGVQNIMQQQQVMPEAALTKAQAANVKAQMGPTAALTSSEAARNQQKVNIVNHLLPYAADGSGGVAGGVPQMGPAPVGTSGGVAGGTNGDVGGAPVGMSTAGNIANAVGFDAAGMPGAAGVYARLIPGVGPGMTPEMGPDGQMAMVPTPGYAPTEQFNAQSQAYGHSAGSLANFGDNIHAPASTGLVPPVYPGNTPGPATPLPPAMGSVSPISQYDAASAPGPRPPSYQAALNAIPPTLRSVVQGTAAAAGVPLPIVAAVGAVESQWQNPGPNQFGAMGPMQVTPGAAGGGYNLADPQQNTIAGINYLARLHHQYGDWGTALAVYNAGSKAPNPAYASKVLSLASSFGGPPGPQQAGAMPQPQPAPTAMGYAPTGGVRSASGTAPPAAPQPTAAMPPVAPPPPDNAAPPAQVQQQAQSVTPPGYVTPPNLPANPLSTMPAAHLVQAPGGGVMPAPTLPGIQDVQKSAGQVAAQELQEQTSVSDQLSKLSQVRTDILNASSGGGWLAPGTAATERTKIGTAINTAATMLGLPAPIPEGKIADQNAIVKSSVNLAMATAKSFSSRGTNLELQEAISANPSNAQTPFAGTLVANILQQQALYKQGEIAYTRQQYARGVLPSDAAAAYQKLNGDRAVANATAQTYVDMSKAQPNTPQSVMVRRLLALKQKFGNDPAFPAAVQQFNQQFAKVAKLNYSTLGTPNFGQLILQMDQQSNGQ